MAFVSLYSINTSLDDVFMEIKRLCPSCGVKDQHVLRDELMKEEKKEIDQEIIDEILGAIGKLKFGEVVITVHDSRVVQIEKKEKKRFV